MTAQLAHRAPEAPRPIIDRSNCPAKRHGQPWHVNNFGCVCPDTRRLWKAFRVASELGTYESRLLSPVGTRRRIQALCAAGYTYQAQAEHMGYQVRNAVRNILLSKRVNRATAEKVAKMYDELSTRLAPNCQAATRARNLARKKGWPEPIAWYGVDIDDPAAEPIADSDLPSVEIDEMAVDEAAAGRLPAAALTKKERQLLVHKLDHLTANEIAERTGYSQRRVQWLRSSFRRNNRRVPTAA